MIHFGQRFVKMNEEGSGASGGAVVMSGDAAAAAVAAAAAAATPEARTEARTDDGNFEWAKTGHASLDIALGWLGKQGLGETNELVQLAARTGNFDGLKAHFAQNATPGSAEMLSILETSFNDFVSQHNANVEKETAAQVEFLGGPERATAVIDWAGANAEPQEKAAFNAMMDAGGFQARAALAYVSSLYDKATGGSEMENIVAAQVATAGAGRGGPSAPTTPLTRAKFADEAQKLYQQYGDSYNQTAAYRALARRVV